MKKILLIHGWNYHNYTKMTKETDAWHNRKQLVETLQEEFKVYKLNLPGFCGAKEPKKAWTLDDYADFIHEYLVSNKLDVDYILGYSFGGAVAISYYLRYGQKEKIVLISPAIIRNNFKSKEFVKTPKFLRGLRNLLRDFYLIYIVKTNEMAYGTKFLRNTYQIIAREDLKEELLKIPANNLLIIYGANDDMVKPQEVFEFLPPNYQKRVKLIVDGDHNVGQSHRKEVIKLIKDSF